MSPRGADLRQAVLATRAASPRVVLAVGELNPYGSRPEYAPWHEPRGAAGDRLRRIMGLTDEQYLATVARMNLCDGPKWSTPWARERFWDGVDFGAHALVVLLGARVRDAAMGPPFFQVAGGVGPCVFLSLPHPSGRCRAWNDKTQVDRARAALRASAPGIPWGCAGDAL